MRLGRLQLLRGDSSGAGMSARLGLLVSGVALSLVVCLADRSGFGMTLAAVGVVLGAMTALYQRGLATVVCVLAIVHLAFARSPSSAVVMAVVVVLAVFLVCAQLAEAGLPFAGVVGLQTLLTEHLRSVLLGIVGAALVLMLSLIDISSTAVALLLVVIALAAVVTTIGAVTRTLETND